MMADKEMFSYWVTQPELLEKTDVEKLEQLTEKYPYFQLAHMLLVKAVASSQPDLLSRYLPKTAVHTLNRRALNQLIENDMEWSVELLDRFTKTTVSTGARSSVPSQSSILHVTPPVQPLEEKPLPEAMPLPVSRAKEPVVPFDPTAITEFALTQQLYQGLPTGQPAAPRTQAQELIERFIKSDPVIGALQPNAAPVEEHVDLSLRNQAELEDFATESFAEILVKQGKIDRAIGIYERLILKIPEKRDYFAKKIEKLR